MPTRKETKNHLPPYQILLAENRRLKKEISLLKRELEQSGGNRPWFFGEEPYRIQWIQQAQNEVLFSKKRYIGYIIQFFRNTAFFSIYKKLIAFFRRYALIVTTIQILVFLFGFFQSSVVIVLATSLSVILFPFLFLISYILFLLALFSRQKNNLLNQQKMFQKKLYVFFPPKGRAFSPQSFFAGMVHEYAQMQNCICVVVSPYFFRSIGFHKAKPYWFSREENNVIFVRRPYYFSLKKTIFSHDPASVIEMF